MQYTKSRGIIVEGRLGYGKDGSVWSTSRTTAVKAHERASTFDRELAAYLRLREHGVESVLGLAVPRLMDWDAGLRVVEMTIVQPPFVLDFGSAWLDGAPEFSDGVMADWLAEKEEQFEADWPRVAAVLGELRRKWGVHLLDVHPGNVMLRGRE
ncbi:MAG: hypothetical protein KIS87_00380 [Phycisphaeraceae bacterium]|nr:hypothetical protein [Phycisphaeraceae bacterium]